MAKCLITESSTLGKYGAQVIKPLLTQAVTYTTSTASTAFPEGTVVIRVIADADVYLAFGASPTADANGIRVPADTVEYFGVLEGQKVACYDGSS